MIRMERSTLALMEELMTAQTIPLYRAMEVIAAPS